MTEKDHLSDVREHEEYLEAKDAASRYSRAAATFSPWRAPSKPLRHPSLHRDIQGAYGMDRAAKAPH
ncbi:MAG: hypothetical protein V3S51_09030 [Dehalococcoidia bacterium]